MTLVCGTPRLHDNRNIAMSAIRDARRQCGGRGRASRERRVHCNFSARADEVRWGGKHHRKPLSWVVRAHCRFGMLSCRTQARSSGGRLIAGSTWRRAAEEVGRDDRSRCPKQGQADIDAIEIALARRATRQAGGRPDTLSPQAVRADPPAGCGCATPGLARFGAESDRHRRVLDLKILLDAPESAFAADAGVLESAKRRLRCGRHAVVDADDAVVERLGDAVRAG
jgi:hypothetical protein